MSLPASGTGARPGSRTPTRVRVVETTGSRVRVDHVATEEPLEIRLSAGGGTRTVAVTMRTPGSDFELAAGFLHGEGVIADPGEIRRISYCIDPAVDDAQRFNIVNVHTTTLPDLRPLERHFHTTSACGVCGKASLDALEVRPRRPLAAGPKVAPDVLLRLPGALRAAQDVFESTGGLHACGLFDATGRLVVAREDVGRHNAVDKVMGWALLNGRLPLSGGVVMVSGRSSFEIMQKCLVAGVAVVCAVSAPSSLAVAVARRFGMTLVGFLRDRRFNVYTGHERIG